MLACSNQDNKLQLCGVKSRYGYCVGPVKCSILSQTYTVLLDPSSGNTQQQPVYAQNAYRSINPEIFVVVGLCTHLGCIPAFRPEVAAPDLGIDWLGGYFSPCHGSRFDLAGRVYKHVPAPSYLLVPPHRYLSESVIKIGETQLAHNSNVNEQDEPAD